MKAEITCLSELTCSMGKHKPVADVLQHNDMVSLMLQVCYNITHSPHFSMLCSGHDVFSLTKGGIDLPVFKASVSVPAV